MLSNWKTYIFIYIYMYIYIYIYIYVYIYIHTQPPAGLSWLREEPELSQPYCDGDDLGSPKNYSKRHWGYQILIN